MNLLFRTPVHELELEGEHQVSAEVIVRRGGPEGCQVPTRPFLASSE